MGTRSHTYFIDGFDEPTTFCCIYRQFDGYPSGHGQELADFLADIEMVNGIPCLPKAEKQRRFANGMSCLAAQVIAHFKTEPGGIYVNRPDYPDDDDFGYYITGDTMQPNKGLRIKVTSFGRRIFEGTVTEFAAFCKEPLEEE